MIDKTIPNKNHNNHKPPRFLIK